VIGRRALSFSFAGLALAATLAGTPATAGCDSFGTTPTESFREVNARPGIFVMAVGRFSDGEVIDQIFALGIDGTETSTRIVAGHFTGMSATKAGFTESLDTDVEIAQRCDSRGCAPVLDDTRYLVFLQRLRGRLQFAEDGCALRAYAEPTPAVLEAMIGCMNGVCE